MASLRWGSNDEWSSKWSCSENSTAHRIYSANQRLDLALKGCANESKIIGDALSFVQNFIRHSPSRMSTYEIIASELLKQNEHVESLHLLCPIRWTVRTKAIQAIYDTLKSISRTGFFSEIRDKSNGLAKKMTKFTTFFGLHVHFAVNIFSVSEQRSTTIQTKGILAQTVMAGVQCLKDNFNSIKKIITTFSMGKYLIKQQSLAW